MKRFCKVFLPAICFSVLWMPGILARPVMSVNSDCPNITGQITYFNNAATPLYDVQVQLMTAAGQLLQTTTTDYMGQYGFCQLTPGNYIITAASTRPAGGINATDALIALRHYVGQITLTGLKFEAADINDNGYVNSTDALMILRRFVGQIATFPAGDWVFESNTIAVTDDIPLVLNFRGLCYGDLDATFIPAGCSPLPTPSDAGPDQTVTGTATNLAGNTPLSGTGEWSIGSGTGGSVAEPGNPLSAFSGVAGNTYTLVWTITTGCASSTDTVQITFTSPNFTCGSSFTDTRDGQVYNTVQIGTQCWMMQNLNIGTMVNSTIAVQIHSDCSNNGIIEKYCYDNDPAMCAVYGGVYDWDEMMGYTSTPGVQGICPADWHLPTDDEWCALSTFLDQNANCNVYGPESFSAGGKLKEAGLAHWLSPNTGATNESGFTALPGGERYGSGAFGAVGISTNLWTSTEYGASAARSRGLSNYSANVARISSNRTYGSSVRCLRDEGTGCSPLPTPSDAGPDQTVTGTATNLAGNTPLSGTGEWSIGSGTGGSVAEPGNPLSAFSGVAGNTYTLVWTITTGCASSTDTVQITFTSPTFTCGSSFTDTRDGQVYNTVQIGTQCWMQQNLNIGVMIPNNQNPGDNQVIEKYCYSDDILNCSIYGGQYNWNEMMQYTTVQGVQGICPAAWHIPTDQEWCALLTFLDPAVDCDLPGLSGINGGGKMKETGTVHWNTPNTGATNESGFTVLPAGYHYYTGLSDGLGLNTWFWSSSESVALKAYYRYLYYNAAKVGWGNVDKSNGFSVRCLRD
ncbi:MAG TPA: FISUMP domain-containing protein [Bacteroidales bacterium]|nr:FISUMP domain-containing protein [Bacteroidales bacterium]HSA42424.1 FISUMP domain-containing protein [Bacteroidales bacterium]